MSRGVDTPNGNWFSGWTRWIAEYVGILTGRISCKMKTWASVADPWTIEPIHSVSTSNLISEQSKVKRTMFHQS